MTIAQPRSSIWAGADEELAQAAQMACLLEVSAHKPGNVTAYHRFGDTGLEDFLLSALAIGPAFRQTARSTVGETVLSAIRATRRLVQSNTNLGIVLLLAPLARAASLADPVDLRDRLRVVLRGLTVDDARAVYTAIRLASPGGLGHAETNDVDREPDVSLLEAMRTAAGWDSIAREYATDFAVTFELGTPVLAAALAQTADVLDAIVQTFLVLLAELPDSLIARKVGDAAARDVAERARQVLAAGGLSTPAGCSAIRDLDAHLRDPTNRLNPGTTADLTTATIFLHLIQTGDLRAFSGRPAGPTSSSPRSGGRRAGRPGRSRRADTGRGA